MGAGSGAAAPCCKAACYIRPRLRCRFLEPVKSRRTKLGLHRPVRPEGNRAGYVAVPAPQRLVRRPPARPPRLLQPDQGYLPAIVGCRQPAALPIHCAGGAGKGDGTAADRKPWPGDSSKWRLCMGASCCSSSALEHCARPGKSGSRSGLPCSAPAMWFTSSWLTPHTSQTASSERPCATRKTAHVSRQRPEQRLCMRAAHLAHPSLAGC